MEWTEWRPFYERIVVELNLDVERDIEATKILTELLEDIDPRPLLNRLDETIRNKSVIVCGAGPSLEEHLKVLMGECELVEASVIAADGAASALHEAGLDCDILVTDLDSSLESIRKCSRDGALVIVHAHGDNIGRIREVVPQLDSTIGSTQVEPTHRAFLWGGFTDGDRSCFVASHYGPKRMIIAGMDLGDTVGKWSKPGHEEHYPASARKRTKLRIAGRLLTHLFSTTTIEYRMMK